MVAALPARFFQPFQSLLHYSLALSTVTIFELSFGFPSFGALRIMNDTSYTAHGLNLGLLDHSINSTCDKRPSSWYDGLMDFPRTVLNAHVKDVVASKS